jgi:hypothetical protein
MPRPHVLFRARELNHPTPYPLNTTGHMDGQHISTSSSRVIHKVPTGAVSIPIIQQCIHSWPRYTQSNPIQSNPSQPIPSHAAVEASEQKPRLSNLKHPLKQNTRQLRDIPSTALYYARQETRTKEINSQKRK